MAKISRPVLYVGLAAVAVAAYILTEPEQIKTSSTARPKASPTNKSAEKRYLDEDYTASFPRLASLERNTFDPLIARRSGTDLLQEGGVPSDFAGGDPNWVCTGTAEVNGARMALLENKATGEGVFVQAGDTWKNAVVSEILGDGVVMAGPGGTVRSIMVLEDEWEAEEEVVEPVAPAQVPGLSGPIGPGPGNIELSESNNGRGGRGNRRERTGVEAAVPVPPQTATAPAEVGTSDES